jgi:Ca2+-binding RTX toxin-like protein
MRRTTTVTLVVAVLLALTAAAALAATIDPINCPNADLQNSGYNCEGTTDADTMNGTSGPDIMAGFAGSDTLNGNDGDDKIDALEPEGDTVGGVDTVSGGPGNDTIGANDGVKGDDIDCGPGSRDIAYSDKGDSVSSNCEWQPPYDTAQYCPASGPPWIDPEATGGGWPDHVPHAGGKIIWCIDGTPRDDKKLHGTTGYSDLLDIIWADKGNDKIDGGVGPDSIEGWSGNDILKGGAGGDFLYGDSSANPWPNNGFFKGAGEDKIYGGPGNDYIAAIDNKKDTISCGGGKDYVQADKSGVADNPTPGRSTVTDKVANDCEDIFNKAEHSTFFCRIFGHRKRH